MSEPNDGSKFAPIAATQGGNPSVGKVSIASIDEQSIRVVAQFNPKELEVGRSVPWSKPNQANRSNRRGRGGNSGDDQGIHLEFTGAEGRSISLELLFDGYEADAKGRAVDVPTEIEKLEKLASVREPGSKKDEMKRPHRCLVVWGDEQGGVLPNFKCVIESLNVKYTMFNQAGKPLRATAIVKLKEADVVSVAKKK